MSKKSRIFVSAKNKISNPFKTPRRWAKRQTDMQKSVIVTIERLSNKAVVSNDKGKKWEIPFEMPYSNDGSVQGVVADIASAMLTGTIVSQLKESNAPTIRFTLTIETK